jgi:hypothetical protein
MLIKNEIQLFGDSEQHIKETFDMYEEVIELKIVKNPILHIYPKQDTYNSEGELDGYIDALFSKVHIYDTKNKTVHRSNKLHDAILPTTDIKVLQFKVFKDLSFMIVMQGTYDFSRYQAMNIEKIG